MWLELIHSLLYIILSPGKDFKNESTTDTTGGRQQSPLVTQCCKWGNVGKCDARKGQLPEDADSLGVRGPWPGTWSPNLTAGQHQRAQALEKGSWVQTLICQLPAVSLTNCQVPQYLHLLGRDNLTANVYVGELSILQE